MNTIEFRTIEIVDDAAPMQLSELLTCLHIERTALVEMVEAGVVSPVGVSVEQWTFARGDLRRLRTAQRLIADLDLNVVGAALLLDLLDERDALLKRIQNLSAFLDNS